MHLNAPMGTSSAHAPDSQMRFQPYWWRVSGTAGTYPLGMTNSLRTWKWPFYSEFSHEKMWCSIVMYRFTTGCWSQSFLNPTSSQLVSQLNPSELEARWKWGGASNGSTKKSTQLLFLASRELGIYIIYHIYIYICSLKSLLQHAYRSYIPRFQDPYDHVSNMHRNLWSLWISIQNTEVVGGLDVQSLETICCWAQQNHAVIVGQYTSTMEPMGHDACIMNAIFSDMI